MDLILHSRSFLAGVAVDMPAASLTFTYTTKRLTMASQTCNLVQCNCLYMEVIIFIISNEVCQGRRGIIVRMSLLKGREGVKPKMQVKGLC